MLLVLTRSRDEVSFIVVAHLAIAKTVCYAIVQYDLYQCSSRAHHTFGACMCTGTIMRAIAPLLLCLLSTLVEVHSQTIPYVSFMGTNLTNHSYVDLTLVGVALDGSDSVQCHTDLSTCCSSVQGVDRGDWFFPNGERLQFNGDPGDIYETRDDQRVDLRRRNNGDTSGIYRCDIETNTVNDDVRESVYVGLYASGGECV